MGGDGLGAKSCELAHLAVEAHASAARAASASLACVFVGVIQGFPSIVVALALPLPEREADTKALLQEAGFDAEATLEIIADNLQNSECGEMYPRTCRKRSRHSMRNNGRRAIIPAEL